MRDDVNSFIVEVEEAHEAAPSREEGPVACLDVGVKLQVFGQVVSFEQGLFRPQV